MGIRLIVEVLEHAPDDLTWRERHALTVLAENANDGTRECWPGIEEDEAIAHRMRLPGRSSRYEVMKALRAKKAIETVSAGRRGHRAVYRITDLAPAKGPGTPDANGEKGSGEPGHGVRETWTQSTRKGPGTTDPNSGKGSGNDPERVREPHGRGPGTTDPFPSDPSTPQEEEASAPSIVRTITADDKDEYGRFWVLFPKSKDPDRTRDAWIAEVLAGADPEQITAAAVSYAREVVGEPWRFVKTSARWLTERRYLDKHAPEPNGKPNLRAVDGNQRPGGVRGPVLTADEINSLTIEDVL